MIKISLVPIGKIEERILSYLQVQLAAKLKAGNLEIKLRPALALPEQVKKEQPGQGLSALVLASLARTGTPELDEYVLAVIDEDLTDPAIEYVLAEAAPALRLGVISLARLRQEFYKLPPEEEVFSARLLKLALQTLGTLWGLARCPDVKCPMAHGRNTHELDRKYTVYCLNCWPQVRRKLGLT